MNIGIYTNKYKDDNYTLTLFALKFLKDRGVNVFFHKSIKQLSGANVFEFNQTELDALIVFGGDGTILGIAEAASKAKIPVLGINTGSFGFLTEAESDCLESALCLLLEKKFTLEKRSMLMTDFGGKRYYALNDIVFLRDMQHITPKKLICLEVYSDDTLIDKINADGIIVSTPTGSTAYSLSAGGPILSPHIAANVITAICPHTLHFRPLVFGDSQKIKVGFGEGESKATLIFDGNNKFSIIKGQYIEIVKADIGAEFIRLGNTNFYEKLRNKMNKWSIT